MAAPSPSGSKGVYRLASKSSVGNWIMLAMLLIAVSATFLAPPKDRFLVTMAIAGFLLVGMSGLAIWVLKGPNERIETDDGGIAAFDSKNSQLCRVGWSEVTSYSSAPGSADAGRTEMVLKSPKGEIRFPISAPGFTRLNSTILRHLPAGVSSSKADLRSLLPASDGLMPTGERRFGRLGMLPWVLLLLAVGFGSLLYKDPKEGRIPLALLWVPALFLGLGLPGLVAVFNERYVVSADGITYYNWLGRKKGEIAWKDVTAFEINRKARGGQTRNYTLVGRDSQIDLDSLITRWSDLVKIILALMPPDSTVDLGPYSLPA